MLRDTAVSLIAARLGNRTDLNDSIIAEMQLVQETLEHGDFLPFFLISEQATTSTTIDEERLVLPGDFLREFEEGAFWYYTNSDENTYTPLIRREMEEIKGAGLESGAPQYYAMTGAYLRVAPVPDAVYVVKMIYYATDTLLDTNVENNWLKWAAEWIIAETGARVATYIQNDKLVQRFMQDIQTSSDRFKRFAEGRKHSNQDYRMEYK